MNRREESLGGKLAASGPPDSTPDGSNSLAGRPHIPWYRDLSTVKDIAQIVQSIAAVLALLAAAWFFFWQDKTAQRLDVSHHIEHRVLDKNWLWLRVTTTLKNVGQIPVTVDLMKAKVERILPLEPSYSESIQSGVGLVQRDTGTVLWPSIGNPYTLHLNYSLQPSESYAIDVDFLIPTDLCTVNVYTAVRKVKTFRRRQQIYDRGTVYQLQTGGACDVS